MTPAPLAIAWVSMVAATIKVIRTSDKKLKMQNKFRLPIAKPPPKNILNKKN
jgi:hypothetical protein